MSDPNVMQFVSLKRVAEIMTTTEPEMADVLRSQSFDDETKSAFADFVLSAAREGAQS